MSEASNLRPYDTERIQYWREQEIKPMFIKTLDLIERHGCAVLHIKGDNAGPRFSYTAGVYDTSGHPEVITIGLTEGAAQVALNEAVRLMKSGVDLTVGRHREIVGEVECKFREIDPKWMHHVMGRAEWYYTGEEIPVLQLIYPDLENRFQTEAGFTEYFRQPMLVPGAEMTRIEEDFWSANDPSSSLFCWKFPDDPHTRVFLSKTVHEKTEPVTYVSHDAYDGAWQFLGDKMADGGGPVISCFHHPIGHLAGIGGSAARLVCSAQKPRE